MCLSYRPCFAQALADYDTDRVGVQLVVQPATDGGSLHKQLLAIHSFKSRQRSHAHGDHSDNPFLSYGQGEEWGEGVRRFLKEALYVQWRPATEDGSQWRVQMCLPAMLGDGCGEGGYVYHPR